MKKQDKTNQELITELEKEFLKKRILNSIKKLQIQRRLYKLGAVASIAILITGVVYLRMLNQETSINKFAALSKNVKIEDSDKVTLILDEGNGVAVEGENTAITYSKTGKEINIENQEKVTSEKEGDYNTLVVPYGKRSRLTLADGTQVWLNSGTKFIYPTRFDKKNREVYLVGEAVFDVAHDAEHPFKVLSEHQEIEVLGTVFDVSSYTDDQENFVVLKKGSVKVSHQNDNGFLFDKKRSEVITPGTMNKIEVGTGVVTTKNVNVQQYFAWKDGLLILKKNKLSYIMRKLSRYYNVAIDLENEALSNETFSGALNLSDSIQQVLQVINKSVDIHIEETAQHTLKLMYNNKNNKNEIE